MENGVQNKEMFIVSYVIITSKCGIGREEKREKEK